MKIKSGGQRGLRSLYLTHAKRALYQLSQSPCKPVLYGLCWCPFWRKLRTYIPEWTLDHTFQNNTFLISHHTVHKHLIRYRIDQIQDTHTSGVYALRYVSSFTGCHRCTSMKVIFRKVCPCIQSQIHSCHRSTQIIGTDCCYCIGTVVVQNWMVGCKQCSGAQCCIAVALLYGKCKVTLCNVTWRDILNRYQIMRLNTTLRDVS